MRGRSLDQRKSKRYGDRENTVDIPEYRVYSMPPSKPPDTTELGSMASPLAREATRTAPQATEVREVSANCRLLVGLMRARCFPQGCRFVAAICGTVSAVVRL